MQEHIEISVVVLTYNPNWNKLRATLQSILQQENIDIEIIISDDGSKNDCRNDVEDFFEVNNFCNYTFLSSDVNMGTCQNVYKAINVCKGEYIKLISPGDFLYNSTTLSLWYNFLQSKNQKVSFGNVVKYSIKDEQICFTEIDSGSKNLEIYNEKRYRATYIKENVLLLCDFPIGAAFLVNRELMLKYCQLIVGKVKYAEDFMYRIMVADSMELSYYSEPVVWYEYGEGISTSANSKWASLLEKDLSNAYNVMAEKICEKDFFDRKFKLWIKLNNRSRKLGKYCKYILFPRIIGWNLINKNYKKDTTKNIDTTFLEKVL